MVIRSYCVSILLSILLLSAFKSLEAQGDDLYPMIGIKVTVPSLIPVIQYMQVIEENDTSIKLRFHMGTIEDQISLRPIIRYGRDLPSDSFYYLQQYNLHSGEGDTTIIIRYYNDNWCSIELVAQHSNSGNQGYYLTHPKKLFHTYYKGGGDYQNLLGKVNISESQFLQIFPHAGRLDLIFADADHYVIQPPQVTQLNISIGKGTSYFSIAEYPAYEKTYDSLRMYTYLWSDNANNGDSIWLNLYYNGLRHKYLIGEVKDISLKGTGFPQNVQGKNENVKAEKTSILSSLDRIRQNKSLVGGLMKYGLPLTDTLLDILRILNSDRIFGDTNFDNLIIPELVQIDAQKYNAAFIRDSIRNNIIDYKYANVRKNLKIAMALFKNRQQIIDSLPNIVFKKEIIETGKFFNDFLYFETKANKPDDIDYFLSLLKDFNYEMKHSRHSKNGKLNIPVLEDIINGINEYRQYYNGKKSIANNLGDKRPNSSDLASLENTPNLMFNQLQAEAEKFDTNFYKKRYLIIVISRDSNCVERKGYDVCYRSEHGCERDTKEAIASFKEQTTPSYEFLGGYSYGVWLQRGNQRCSEFKFIHQDDFSENAYFVNIDYDKTGGIDIQKVLKKNPDISFNELKQRIENVRLHYGGCYYNKIYITIKR